MPRHVALSSAKSTSCRFPTRPAEPPSNSGLAFVFCRFAHRPPALLRVHKLSSLCILTRPPRIWIGPDNIARREKVPLRPPDSPLPRRVRVLETGELIYTATFHIFHCFQVFGSICKIKFVMRGSRSLSALSTPISSPPPLTALSETPIKPGLRESPRRRASRESTHMAGRSIYSNVVRFYFVIVVAVIVRRRKRGQFRDYVS